MRKIKTNSAIIILGLTAFLPTSVVIAAKNTDDSTAEILTNEYLKGDSNVASITGSILGGALTAHPAGAVVGSVGGYLIAKFTKMLTHDDDEKLQKDLQIKPEQPHYRQSSPSQRVHYFQRPAVPGYFSSSRSQQYRENYRVAYSSVSPSAHRNNEQSGSARQVTQPSQLTTRIANRPLYYSNMYSRPARTPVVSQTTTPIKNNQAAQTPVKITPQTPNGLKLIRINQ